MTRHLPNFITLLNLFTGCWALVMLFQGNPEDAAWLVFLSAVFDLLDGLVARALHVQSPIGKQLDSLADMVTFGLIPGVVMYQLLQQSDLSAWVQQGAIKEFVSYLPFVVTLFSALRLAKFNVDERQTKEFIGLPTPANTLWVISLPLILLNRPGEWDFILRSAPVILMLCVISSWLLVAEIPLFSFKFSGWSWQANNYPYLLIIISLPLLLFFSFAALPPIIGFYVLLSLIRNQRTVNSKTP